MRLPFLKSKSDAGGAVRHAPGADDAGALQAARTQARRRLIGALVLLGAAVAGFPLLFETQPRPLPGQVSGGASPALVIKGEPAPRSGAADAAPVAAAAAAADASPAAPVAASAVAPVEPAPTSPVAKPEAAVRDAPAAAASQAAAVPTGSDGIAIEAKAKESKAKDAPVKTGAVKTAPEKAAPAAAASAASATVAKAAQSADPVTSPAGEAAVRWVVQVGAYNDMERMRQARQKAEKLGFKTYITDVDTPTGKRTRVRLGPFETKKEADAAAAKVKAAGMAANVLSV